MSSPRSDNPAGSVAASSALDLRVSSELLRIAFHDSLYGVPFATAAAILFAIAAMGSFPSAVVLGWLIATVAWNIARLIVRDRYMRQPVPVEHTRRWAYLFTILAAGSGLCWGTAAWLFYTAHESIFRVMIVLVLAGLTTGASRLLAPIIQANLAYSFFSVGPLITRVLMTSETPSSILVLLCVLYLAYVGIAARQQITTLRRAIRLRHENTALVESLGAAKERAELLNRELTAEMTRRSTVEDDMRAATAQAQAANRAKSDFLATMSHEIRTPMNGIIGMLRILHDTPLSPEQRESIEVAAASADTLLDLLNNILDFSKIEAGRLDLERI
ncbi:MAG TPA: histidine kinase dimerization/phospho-acceptor domain-containing protein, partial [Opitutaceae bacterium]